MNNVSKETREKISESLKGNIPWNKNKTVWYKGLNYEERYGTNKANTLKAIRSKKNERS